MIDEQGLLQDIQVDESALLRHAADVSQPDSDGSGMRHDSASLNSAHRQCTLNSLTHICGCHEL